MDIPTMKVKNPGIPGEYMIINVSDFDPAEHEPFEGETAPVSTGSGTSTGAAGTGTGTGAPEPTAKEKRAADLEALTKDDLADIAEEAEAEINSRMTKAELIEAILAKEFPAPPAT